MTRADDASGGRGAGPGRGAVPVAVGLGSNLGDRTDHLAQGVRTFARLAEDVRCSRVYETEPVGARDQPRFLNMCCVGGTLTSARELLEAFQEAERRAGRRREAGAAAPAPRTLDLDLLLYGRERIEEPGLRVPHPRMTERAFVLVPLAEVAGSWRHPGSGRTVAELAERVEVGGVEPYAGSLPRELERRIGR